MSATYAEFRSAAAALLCERLSLDPSSAYREADHLGGSVLSLGPTELLHHGDKQLASEDSRQLDRLLERRLDGTPLSHLLGSAAFMDLELQCSPATLIPRPETEVLAAAALDLLSEDSTAKIADLGSGTSAIAAAIASKRSGTRIDAFEISEAAAKIAEKNLERFGVDERTQVFAEDWSAAEGPYQLIVANPPYLGTALCEKLIESGELADPRTALDGGLDGMNCLREVVDIAAKQLDAGGDLLVEHGLGQYHSLARIARAAGLSPVARIRDLQGISRIMHAKRDG